ncbi:hypothetical protein HY479_01135 [Candidatus Uhrbacteria bacterium]|nr:hypothetical protein [Candidatus Uhrbacteria bacterium]
MTVNATIQVRAVEAFASRVPGMLDDETLLGMLACILRARPYGFSSVRLQNRRDLLSLTDEEAARALEIIPTLDIPREPRVALSHLAADVRGRTARRRPPRSP